MAFLGWMSCLVDSTCCLIADSPLQARPGSSTSCYPEVDMFFIHYLFIYIYCILLMFANNFTSSKWWNPCYVFSVMKKRNPWSVYCIFVSHQHSSGKNSYLGSWMKSIFCSVSLIWTFFLENLTLTKIFFSLIILFCWLNTLSTSVNSPRPVHHSQSSKLS